MKTEETERQNQLRRWLSVVLVIFIFIGGYLFVGPFLVVWGNGSRTFLDWMTGGPGWLESGWAAINHSYFILQSEFEIYGRYIGWVVEEVAGA